MPISQFVFFRNSFLLLQENTAFTCPEINRQILGKHREEPLPREKTLEVMTQGRHHQERKKQRHEMGAWVREAALADVIPECCRGRRAESEQTGAWRPEERNEQRALPRHSTVKVTRVPGS